MTGGFLLISPPFRGTVLTGLARVMLVLDQYSPYSYIVLALVVGGSAVWSMAQPKPK